MGSFKSYDGPLFPAATDSQWLALIDSGHTYGLEIASPLSGSRSKNARAAAFLGYYLQANGERRSQCVIKLGHAEPIERDYKGWQDFARRQTNRDALASMSPPLVADFGAVVVTDFVGSEEDPMESLADAVSADLPLLPAVIARLARGTLAPLHEARRAHDGRTPSRSLTQAEVVEAWFSPQIVSAAIDRLESDPLIDDSWQQKDLGGSVHMPRLPNLFSDLLAGKALPSDKQPVRLPMGAVHGDPNFDNIFISYDDTEVRGLALIDFEWCSCEPQDSPFDDLARLECELLFGQDLPHRNDLLLSLTLGDVWLGEGTPLAAARPPESRVFDAIAALRKHAAAFADADDPRAVEEFQRGYLLTLLGQAVRYVGYDSSRPRARLEALQLCQLLSARIGKGLDEAPAPGFSPSLSTFSRGKAKAEVIEGSYGLFTEGGSYASLIFVDPYPTKDFTAKCEIEVCNVEDSGWLALSLGVEPHAPERSGLTARIRSDGPDAASVIIYSHKDSRHGGKRDSFLMPWISGARLDLTLSSRSNALTFSVESAASDEPLVLSHLIVPVEEYRGPLALVAYSAEVLVHSLAVRLEPA